MMAYHVLFFIVSIFLWRNASGLEENFTDPNIYENYTVYRLVPHNINQVKDLAFFANLRGDIEILKGSRGINDSHDILVPPHNEEVIQRYARSQNLPYNVKRSNYGQSVARAFDGIAAEREPRRRQGPPTFQLYNYNSYDLMVDFINDIQEKHPKLVQVEDIGKSYEGRIMKMVKISASPDAGNPVIMIDAGIHAREWVAPAMALYIINRLTKSAALEQELNGVDWYIVPLVNPDGYEYTRSNLNNRLWRKTRSRHGTCFGVDGNRNYNFQWGVSGSSFNPCDKETFAGPDAFSESETRVISNTMKKYASRIKLYVSLHSYGQYLVYPWGFTGAYRPKSWRKLDKLAKDVSAAVVDAGGSPFKVLSAGKWYPAAGGSDDYAFGAVGIPYSYTMELTDDHDFIFPSSLLKPTLPQLYAGFQAFAFHIKNEFGTRRNNHDGN